MVIETLLELRDCRIKTKFATVNGEIIRKDTTFVESAGHNIVHIVE